MESVIATFEAGVVRMEKAPAWRDGQRVLVIALPPDEGPQLLAPPAELLEEDARELATKPETIRAAIEDELG